MRLKKRIRLTIAMATVDRYISSLKDYIEKIENVRELLLATSPLSSDLHVDINTADDYENESIYITVSGTSAEQGDDGEAGRGNRANGLITPYRPMTLEAVAGKNPVSHVGKIYNLFANDLSKEIIEEGYAEEAYVYVVSQIGEPIDQPQVLDIRVKGENIDRARIKKLANDMLSEIHDLWKNVVEGRYEIA